jgi:hypothetical protein
MIDSEAALDALRATLHDIDHADVRAPAAAPEELVSEALGLCRFARNTRPFRMEVEEMGFDEAYFDRVEQAAAAAEQAQTEWVLARERGKGRGLYELLGAAAGVRDALFAACRYHLRDEPTIQNELDAVEEGEGAADLILDLDTLAHIVKVKRAHFPTQDPFIDAPALCERARELARELRAAVAEDFDTDGSRATARDLRNRAFTHLEALVSELFHASFYRFYDDAMMLQQLRHLARRRRR